MRSWLAFVAWLAGGTLITWACRLDPSVRLTMQREARRFAAAEILRAVKRRPGVMVIVDPDRPEGDAFTPDDAPAGVTYVDDGGRA